MSTQSKKRPAEQSANEPVPKKRARKRAEDQDDDSIEEIEEDTTYHITATMHSRFNVYPSALRTKLENTYKTTIRAPMATLTFGIAETFKYTYTIVSERSVHQPDHATGPNITICKDNIPSLCIANTALLELFTKSHKVALVKPSFVFLRKQDGMANPEFVRLHSVRHNEIGWGLDANECLSLHFVFIEKGKKNEYNIYVRQTMVKKERDE
ncbi:hypothetical protein FB567DRAFT_141324 [Paraphoma chrysanthemicola]|uniref:Uncharacterized protein n=1 Tax=Paraphoma chrysanthemicola TaxID=798071 RepID=A0A8K0QYX3_9PLEO|nr:hypothetical protein FB567DRAFT_141324 [Paraphoma chrysanthemicola]